MVEEKPKKLTSRKKLVKKATKQLFKLYLEEEVCVLVNEMGRNLKWGDLDDQLEENPTQEYDIIEVPGLDIFGQPLYKKPNFECECPKCKRTLAAARFAPHLEKCMGMGRNSSRIASRRLAASSHSNNHSNANSSADSPSSSKSSANALASAIAGSSGSHVNGDVISEDEHYEEDEDDEEWTMEKKKKTKKNTEKAAPKKKWAISRVKNSGKKSGPPSFNNSPASAVSDPGIEDELEDPLAITH